MLYGISNYNINRLHQFQNSAARIVTNTRKYDHITPILQKLHWLPVRQRIYLKILLVTYKSINDMVPEYLCDRCPLESQLENSTHPIKYYCRSQYLASSDMVVVRLVLQPSHFVK